MPLFYLENAGKIVLPSLIDNPNIGNELLKFRWFISKFPDSKFSLLTSDRPLVMTTGLRRDGCIVALPLGPRLVFFATRDKALLDNALAKAGETGFVRALNESVTSQAHKHVYGSDEAQLNFVEKRLQLKGPG